MSMRRFQASKMAPLGRSAEGRLEPRVIKGTSGNSTQKYKSKNMKNEEAGIRPLIPVSPLLFCYCFVQLPSRTATAAGDPLIVS